MTKIRLACGNITNLISHSSPNWLAHVCMSLLMKLFPPLIAEKILLSAIIGLFPLSLFYFIGAVYKGKDLLGFVGFLFSDHYLLHMGFYSFSISVPLFFFALGYFMKYKEDLNLEKIAILNLLCLLIYFSHILSFLLLILSLTLLTITSFCRKPKRIVALLACMLPLYFIMANYLLTNISTDNKGIELKWGAFQRLESVGLPIKHQVVDVFYRRPPNSHTPHGNYAGDVTRDHII